MGNNEQLAADLASEIQRYESRIWEDGLISDGVVSECLDAMPELAQLREDKELLDWMAENGIIDYQAVLRKFRQAKEESK